MELLDNVQFGHKRRTGLAVSLNPGGPLFEVAPTIFGTQTWTRNAALSLPASAYYTPWIEQTTIRLGDQVPTGALFGFSVRYRGIASVQIGIQRNDGTLVAASRTIRLNSGLTQETIFSLMVSIRVPSQSPGSVPYFVVLGWMANLGTAAPTIRRTSLSAFLY